MNRALEVAELESRVACACVLAYVERAHAIARALGYSETHRMSDADAAAHPEISRLLDAADIAGAAHHNAVQRVRALKGWSHNLGPQAETP